MGDSSKMHYRVCDRLFGKQHQMSCSKWQSCGWLWTRIQTESRNQENKQLRTETTLAQFHKLSTVLVSENDFLHFTG